MWHKILNKVFALFFVSPRVVAAINPLRANPQRSQEGKFCSCEYVYKYADGKSFEPI